MTLRSPLSLALLLVLAPACREKDATDDTGVEPADDTSSADDTGTEGPVDADGDGFDETVDCDDTSVSIYPGAAETCDGLDNNCDGQVDEGLLSTWYPDDDLDGYGDETRLEEACAAPAGYIATPGDCNDDNPQDHSGADELCDGTDNDCDGIIDEPDATDATTWYGDSDGDGWGVSETTAVACAAPAGFVLNDGDCNDGDPSYHPGSLESDCTDPNDYNCDGSVGWADADGDGHAACADCDDTNPDANADADEVCDGVDNDCDSEIDEDSAIDATTWYGDADGDSHGGSQFHQTACNAPGGYVASSDDCDDLDASSYPGASEVCDEADNDCDTEVDEGVTSTWYADSDGDGYGDATTTTEACTPPPGYSTNGDDCNDNAASISPAAIEICDGVDNDCDTEVDESDAINITTWYADADGDGYGDTTTATDSCDAPTGYVDNGSDCNDDPNAGGASQSPGIAEICDGVDNDCSGTADDNATDATTWYADLDSDGFGDPSNSEAACSQPTGYLADSSDCNDTDAATNTSASEICDGADNDCDTDVDEDPTDGTTWYADLDSDGAGDASNTQIACSQPTGFVADNSDCNDDPNQGGAAINTSATEDCSDGIDNNCIDGIDEGYGAPGATGACVATSCQDIQTQRTGTATDGSYSIDPDGNGSLDVSCDMTTDNGGWTGVTGEMMNSNSWMTFSQLGGSGSSSGWVGAGAFDLTASDSGDVILRANATLPWSFTEIFGDWVAAGESGHHAEDNLSTTSWGNSAPSCDGWLLFGTDNDLLKVGGEFNGNGTFNGSGDSTWTQIQTTVSSTSTLRWESNQQCAMPDESIQVNQISLWVR